MKRKMILASGSPRRKELLEGLGLDFDILPDCSEETIREGVSPSEAVMLLAEEKANHVAARYGKEALIIAADTVVALDGEILCKPRDEADAVRMLERLSGRRHRVYTGLAVMDTESAVKSVSYECTVVEFRQLTAGEIRAYVASGEPMDKAGAYGIQDRGALFVKGIEGDYFNVVGLPLCRLGQVLSENFGVELLAGME